MRSGTCRCNLPAKITPLDTTTEKLVTLAHTLRFEDLTPVAIRAAKARIVSTIAVSLAAYHMEPVRIARKLAQPVAAGPAARVYGDGALPRHERHLCDVGSQPSGRRVFIGAGRR